MTLRTRGPILWMVVFFGGAIFQLWRGAPVDTLVYSVVLLLVIIAFQKRFRIPEFRTIRFTTVGTGLLVSSLVFMISPIHSWLDTGFYLLLVPFLLRIALQRDSVSLQGPRSALRRSSTTWTLIGLFTCACELGNYFASDLTHNDKAYPTITVLVDPIVADKLGKAIFVILWATVGVGLLRVSTEK